MKRILILSLISGSLMQSASASHVITFFMRTFPSFADLEYCTNFTKKLSKPGKIAQSTLNHMMCHAGASGIFATYAGYLNVSNNQGQVTFPRKHETPSFLLFITNKITPIFKASNTIVHWQLEDATPVALYSITRVFDSDSNTYFWQVKEQARPKDNILPANAIIIIARPKDIYVPLGITLTDDNEQLQLPDIYVKQGISKASNALYILSLKNFFSPIATTYKKENTHYTSQIVNE